VTLTKPSLRARGFTEMLVRNRNSKATRPSLLDVENPWSTGASRVRVFDDEPMSRDELLRQLRHDAMQRPYIVEENGERRLHFTQTAVQSVMSLQDPDLLVAAYTRKMMAFLLFKPEPTDILMIGLGGGSLAKFCYRHLPNTCITVVEVNRDVIALRDEFCIPRDDRRLRIVHSDGTRYLRRLRTRVDVILVDAFDDAGVAPSLPRSNFCSQAASRLSDDGMLVMNLAGHDDDRYADNIHAVLLAFTGRIVLVPVQGDDNLVLFAHRRSMPREITRERYRLAIRLQAQLQLEFPRFLRLIYQGYVLSRAPTAD
jgi:spermidine synthase